MKFPLEPEPTIPLNEKVQYKRIHRIIFFNEIEPGKKGYQVLMTVSDYGYPFVMVKDIVQETVNTYLIELKNKSIIRIINPPIVEFY